MERDRLKLEEQYNKKIATKVELTKHKITNHFIDNKCKEHRVPLNYVNGEPILYFKDDVLKEFKKSKKVKKKHIKKVEEKHGQVIATEDELFNNYGVSRTWLRENCEHHVIDLKNNSKKKSYLLFAVLLDYDKVKPLEDEDIKKLEEKHGRSIVEQRVLYSQYGVSKFYLIDNCDDFKVVISDAPAALTYYYLDDVLGAYDMVRCFYEKNINIIERRINKKTATATELLNKYNIPKEFIYSFRGRYTLNLTYLQYEQHRYFEDDIVAEYIKHLGEDKQEPLETKSPDNIDIDTVLNNELDTHNVSDDKDNLFDIDDNKLFADGDDEDDLFANDDFLFGDDEDDLVQERALFTEDEISRADENSNKRPENKTRLEIIDEESFPGFQLERYSNENVLKAYYDTFVELYRLYHNDQKETFEELLLTITAPPPMTNPADLMYYTDVYNRLTQSHLILEYYKLQDASRIAKDLQMLKEFNKEDPHRITEEDIEACSKQYSVVRRQLEATSSMSERYNNLYLFYYEKWKKTIH